MLHDILHEKFAFHTVLHCGKHSQVLRATFTLQTLSSPFKNSRSTTDKRPSQVIIKTHSSPHYSPHYFKQLEGEFFLGKKCKSKNCANYIEFLHFPSQQVCAIVMEDVGGISLSMVNTPLDLELFLKVAKKITQGTCRNM